MTSATGRGVPYVVYVNQARDTRSEDGWRVPQGVVSPAAVVTGNLLDPGTSLDELQRLIWSSIDSNRRD
jgi:hypothetical protein